MRKKTTPQTTQEYTRIPVLFKGAASQQALAVKQAVEKREQKSLSWAYVVRLAFKVLAEREGVKCK